MIRNSLQINAKGKSAKRLKSSGENSIGNRSINRSGNGYTCRNYLKDGHNSRSCSAPCKIYKESGHNYLRCLNKKNV